MRGSFFKRSIGYLIAIGLFGYISLCAYLYFYQDVLVFKPDASYSAPNVNNLADMEEITLHTSDGLALRAWYADAPSPSAYTVIYFHGNAGGLAKRSIFYREMIDAGYGVLAVEYRGYSGNKGAPSEAGLYKDAQSAMRYLEERQPLSRVIVMGRSLGSGVAVEMAMHYSDIAALVLISPYTSIPDVGANMYPYIPVHWLSRHHFASVDKIGGLDIPILIAHGTDDSLIPVSHAYALQRAIKSRAVMHLQQGKHHRDLSFTSILDAMRMMLQSGRG